MQGVHLEASRSADPGAPSPLVGAGWGERWPDANLGIATGPVSGLVVVDVDGPEGEAALRKLGLALPPTLEVQTGRGRHLYYTVPDGAATKTLAVHLDVRGAGA